MILDKFTQYELVITLFRTFIARAIAALGSFVLLVVLGRLYGAEGVGLFAIGQSIYIGVSILSRYGMDNALMRYVGQDPSSKNVRSYLYWALRRTSIITIVVTALLLMLRNVIVGYYDSNGLSAIYTYMVMIVFPFNIAFVIAGFMKGVRKPAIACLLENGGISLLAAIIIYTLSTCRDVTIKDSALVLFISTCIMLTVGITVLTRWFNSSNLKDSALGADKSQFYGAAKSFFFIGVASFIQTVVTVLIIGFILNESDLGLFKATEKVAYLISFILVVINAVMPPRYAELYSKNRLEELEILVKKTILYSLILVLPVFSICFFYPKFILSLIGDEFLHANLLLKLVAVAQLYNVVTGAFIVLLNMTGKEKIVRNISLSVNAISIIFYYVLTNSFGVIGAAVSLSLVLVTQNSIALLVIFRKAEIKVLPKILYAREKKNDN